MLAYLQLSYVFTANWELKRTVFVLFSNSLFNLELIWNLFKKCILLLLLLLLLRCCATNQKVAGSIPDGVIGIFK